MSCTRRRFSWTVLSAGTLTLARAAEGRAPIRTISRQPHLYHGWPTVARRANGDLVLVWSGGREAHVCPFGRVEWMVSRDEGESWSWPRVLLDSDIDDRDAGVVETARGTILVTTFTSLAFENVQTKGWPADRLARWQAVRERLSPEQRKAQLGCWMLRSTDGGVSWSKPYRVPVNSPHGPVAVSGGRLLYAGKDLWGTGRAGISESIDDGLTWHWLGQIPARPGDRVEDYHELHLAEAGNRLLVHIRNHNPENRGETLQSESDDRGRTWSPPRPIGVWGLPSHLLRLREHRLLMSYGHRRKPFGNQARVSADGGRTWSAALTLSGDGASGDLGYPSTVELRDGHLLTVWYERRPDSSHAVLRQLKWRLEH
ncbi:MAG: exo-alpha-sialidase [Acidobacteria bacterium]|nr:exo-alpha-sialidase [Acidobacteriota bacterium]MBI3278915.1 exo-alpha-sialidase [Acidobacteriota bacterium]